MHICTNTILHCGVKKRNFDQLLNFVALHTSPYSLITAKLGTKERSVLCQNSPPAERKHANLATIFRTRLTTLVDLTHKTRTRSNFHGVRPSVAEWLACWTQAQKGLGQIAVLG